MEKKQNIKKVVIIIIVAILIFCIRVYFLINSYSKTELSQSKIELTQLKVNGPRQMMGYIIKTNNGKTIIIDGGTHDDTQNLIKHINEKGGKVDAWFITHPHDDHASCLIDIIENTQIPIEKIYVTMNSLEWYEQYESSRAEYINELLQVLKNERITNNVEEVTINRKIKIDNVECEILGVKNPEITTNAINNSSMVIKMQVNDTNILFLGDTGEESAEKLLKNQKKKLKAEYVQMAHHGQLGASKELYQAIDPKTCLWPTPDWLWNNDAGTGEDSGTYKTKVTRRWIEELQVERNIIEKDGDIKITIE